MNIRDSFPIKKVNEMPIAYTDRPGPKHTYDRTAVNPADKELRLVDDKIYMARLTPSGCMWSVLELETWTPKQKTKEPAKVKEVKEPAKVKETKETPKETPKIAKAKKAPAKRVRKKTTKEADASKKEE